jgi:hypothetical protein
MLSCAATRYTLFRAIYGVPARRPRHSSAIERLKNPSRGGQNLSERFRRLEKSLRGKGALSQNLDTPHTSEGEIAAGSPSLKKAEMFRGFRVPLKPIPPADDGSLLNSCSLVLPLIFGGTECCMSGCAVCVYDLYEESLDAYREKLDAIRTSLSLLNIPESEWPEHMRSAGGTGGAAKRKDVILNAFEEMERALKAKQEGLNVSAGLSRR